jgi:hypothetical protein
MSGSVNGAVVNHPGPPRNDSLSQPTPRIDRIDLDSALETVHQASPKKQLVRNFKKAFLTAVDERMKAGAFNNRVDAQKWLIARALLYYEKKTTTWNTLQRSYALKPKEFFENQTYLEDSPIWEEPRERLSSQWEAAEQGDEKRVRELSESLLQTAKSDKTSGHVNLRVDLTRLSDVEARRVECLWEPYIPLGMLSMLSGDPSIGKSFIALSMAAKLSRGEFGHGRTLEPGTTLYLTNENPIAECVRPRFDLLGGDPARLVLLNGKKMTTEDGEEATVPITLGDVDALDQAIRETGARLVIVDPIQSFMGASVDLHRSNETRPIMDALAKVAEKHRCAILLLRHLSKQAGGKAIYRGLGSIDLTGAVRSEMLAGSLPDDPDARALIHFKNNVGPLGTSLGYTIDKEGRFTWTGESRLTSADLLAAPAAASGDRKLTEATRWLTEILHSGSREQKEISAMAEQAGISNATLRRAKDALGIRSYRASMSGPWMWCLSDEGAHKDVHTEILSTFGMSEHLPTCSTAKKILKISPLDYEDAQKGCVSASASIFESNYAKDAVHAPTPSVTTGRRRVGYDRTRRIL